MQNYKYLGIDLGTTNSAVAVCEDGSARLVRNPRGEINNPSVVRVTEEGLVVGAKARKFLHSDAGNTFKEFKRLMGNRTPSKPDRHGKRWLPEELSAVVLKQLKEMAESQENCSFDKVVITVPALFELPQSHATAEAGRLAGFQQVELLPEPVASGLAAGWSETEAGKAWLVYDLGGGTFDASLLEARDGLLRVVGHDGDNFLGGRDIDRAIVEWTLEQLQQRLGLHLDTQHIHYPAVRRHLESAAENAKIRLSSTSHSLIELDFDYSGENYELDLEFDRNQLEQLCQPLVQRSIDICLRLLRQHGLPREQLARVVLVGGPAHMPVIQQMVAQQLAPLAESEHDPMGLVAEGAARYAATISLGCLSSSGPAQPSQREADLWLQFPSVCSELNPGLLGRVLDTTLGLHRVEISRADGQWESGPLSVDSSGLFLTDLALKMGTKNQFQLRAFDRKGTLLDLHYSPIIIHHGLSISDPPLSRSIGVALADGSVRKFIERGTPLPAKRSFVQTTVETLLPNSTSTLEIPIVQGERSQARFCRKVGHLQIEAGQLNQILPAGSAVEITIEVDRGGDLRARARLPEHNKLIEGVAQLLMENTSPAQLLHQAEGLNPRLSQLMQQAFRERDEATLKQLNPLADQLQQSLRELARLQEEDSDQCQRLSRNLIELEAELELVEARAQLAELLIECEHSYHSTAAMVSEYGNEADQRILDECAKQLESAIDSRRSTEVERLIERLNQLHHSVHRKSPYFWVDVFNYWSSYVHDAKNPKLANKLVEQGRAAIAKESYKELRRITNDLYALIPERLRHNTQYENYDSGIF